MILLDLVFARHRRMASRLRELFPEWDEADKLSALGGAALLMAGAILMGGCAWMPPAELRREQFLLGTEVAVTAVAPDEASASAAVAGALEEIARIEALLSSWSEESEITLLNRNAGEWVSLSRETLEVLAACGRFGEMTRGAFDPTVGPLIDLWRESERRGRPPDETELEEALSRVGYRRIQVDVPGGRARLEPGSRVDLGAIGKGYAVDRAGAVLLEKGGTGGVINAGGDLRLLGELPERLSMISIRNPDHPETSLGEFLPPRGSAVATSGNYLRYFEIDGIRFGHVLDPRTGLPIRGVKSATVIAPDAMTADALATAILVAGQEEADRLAHQEGIGFVIVGKDGEVSSSFPFGTKSTAADGSDR